MSVATLHPQYTSFISRWRVVDDWLDEQDVIRAKGEVYLPMTEGMRLAGHRGRAQYDSYVKRARAPSVLRQAMSGIMGLMFKKEPVGGEDLTPVTNTGLTVTELARDVSRAVIAHGRALLVVDAPTEGGDPYITLYPAQAAINWKTRPDNEYRLSLLVIKEQVSTSNDEFSHDTADQYRVYRESQGTVTVQLYDHRETPITEQIVLPTDRIDAVFVGSINTSPAVDPVPLYPVAQCAIAAYQVSADLKQDLLFSGQKQLWLSGMDEEQFRANIEAGYGAGSVWYLGEEGGSAGFIESSGNAYADMAAERKYELSMADEYAVRLARSGDQAESGKSLQIRASAQHASIFTIADSVSIGINEALQARAKWAGKSLPPTFYLQTDFTEAQATEQMLRSLNDAINSLNAPRSAMFELLRQSGLTTEDDDELQRQIEEASTGLIDQIGGIDE